MTARIAREVHLHRFDVLDSAEPKPRRLAIAKAESDAREGRKTPAANDLG